MLQNSNEELDKLKKKIASLEKQASSKPLPTLAPEAKFDIKSLIQQASPLNAIEEIFKTNLPTPGGLKQYLGEIEAQFNTMEDAVTSLAKQFAGARGQAQSIKKAIEGATPSVVALGGSMQDVINIQQGVVSALQKQVILGKEAYGDIYSIGKLVTDGQGDVAVTTKDLILQFKNLGVSVYDISEQMGEVLNTARDMGVATSAVYKQLSDNAERLNLYNFENGVKGMGKMAAEAASLRQNMSTTLDVAERIYKPEDALNMASAMQRLGVNVSNLLDPFKMMDMSLNNPEELQKSLNMAAAEFIKFDEQQRKFIVTDQRRLREYATEIGISAKEVAQMGINFADMQRKMEMIDFGTEITSEEDRKFFAGLAELKGDKYLVNVALDDSQEPIFKELKDLSDEERKRLRRDEADRKKTPSELQMETNHILTNIAHSIGAMKGVIPRRIAASARMDTFVRSAGEAYMPLVRGVQTRMGVETVDGRMDLTKFYKRIDTTLDKAAESLMDVIKDPTKGTNVSLASLTTAVFGAKDSLIDFVDDVKKLATAESKRGFEEGEYQKEIDYTKQPELFEKLKEAFDKSLDFYSNSPALSISLWGDNIKLIDTLKTIPDSIKDQTTQFSEIIDGLGKKDKPAVTLVKENEKTSPSEIIKKDEGKKGDIVSTTSTNTSIVTNYGDVITNIGKNLSTINALPTLVEIVKNDSENRKSDFSEVLNFLKSDKGEKKEIVIPEYVKPKGMGTTEKENIVKTEENKIPTNLDFLKFSLTGKEVPAMSENPFKINLGSPLVNLIEKNKLESTTEKSNETKDTTAIRTEKEKNITQLISEITKEREKRTIEPKTNIVETSLSKVSTLLEPKTKEENVIRDLVFAGPKTQTMKMAMPTDRVSENFKNLSGISTGEKKEISQKNEIGGELTLNFRAENPDVLGPILRALDNERSEIAQKIRNVLVEQIQTQMTIAGPGKSPIGMS